MKRLIFVILLMMLSSSLVIAEETEVVVTLPEFDININGNVIDNYREPYPFML